MTANYPNYRRNQDQWSDDLRARRPRILGGWLIPLILALVQTVLLYLTTTAQAASGALYRCSSPCGTAAQPTTPAIAIIFGVAILLIPIAIGALSSSWQAAVAVAGIPVVLAVTLNAGKLLTPTINFTSDQSGSIPVSHFGTPIWLDSAHIMPIILALGLFSLLGWFGWAAKQAIE